MAAKSAVIYFHVQNGSGTEANVQTRVTRAYTVAVMLNVSSSSHCSLMTGRLKAKINIGCTSVSEQ